MKTSRHPDSRSRPGGRLQTGGSAPPDPGSKILGGFQWIFRNALTVVVVAPLVLAQQDKTEAHVMLMVSEPGARRIMKEVEFSKQAQPGADKMLKLLVESSRSCRAVIAAFNKEGSVAYDGLPVNILVKENRNNQIPSVDAPKWTWDGHEKLSEIDVVLLAENSPELAELSRLVDAMRDPALADAVRKRQLVFLHRWIDTHAQSTSAASDYTLKSGPVLIGGTVRGEGCDWCKSAKTVSIPGGGSAVIRIRLE
jgi:hypothetical protein